MQEKFRMEELLECELTNEELIEKGGLLSRKSQEKSRLENEKTAQASKYKASIDGCIAEIETLSLAITTRRESRTVKCDIKYNEPIQGQKTVTRTDTKGVVRIMMMSDAEKKDLQINGLGDQELMFVFIDKRECVLIDQADCSQSDAAEWESQGFPATNETLVEAPLDPKTVYRVIKGADPENSGAFLYQVQKRKTALEEEGFTTKKKQRRIKE